MSTCRDCFNCELCKSYSPYPKELIQEAEKDFEKYGDVKEKCKHFKDKSKIVELSVAVGQIVYIKNRPLIVSFINIGKEEVTYVCQFDCDDCGDCPFYEDEVSFEGEHDCRTMGYIEFTEKDFSKTVFTSKEEAEKALEKQKE